MHADVDPRDEVRLCDVLTVEELVEVDHRVTRKVQVPLGTRSGLRLLALRHREVVPSPVRVFKQTLRAYDRLQRKPTWSVDRPCMREGWDTYVVDRRIARVDCVSAGDAPAVLCVLVDEGVAALEVLRELEQRVVLSLDELLRDLLLDDL